MTSTQFRRLVAAFQNDAKMKFKKAYEMAELVDHVLGLPTDHIESIEEIDYDEEIKDTME